jgi:hypothetical protein
MYAKLIGAGQGQTPCEVDAGKAKDKLERLMQGRQ